MLRLLTHKNLLNSYEGALKSNAKYFAIVVSINGDEEIIINKMDAVKEHKLEYWLKTYDQGLAHVNNSNIRITGITYGDTFDSIEKDLM